MFSDYLSKYYAIILTYKIKCRVRSCISRPFITAHKIINSWILEAKGCSKSFLRCFEFLPNKIITHV